MTDSPGKKIDRRQFLHGATGASLALAVAGNANAKEKEILIPTDITELSASDLSSAIHSRQLSCVEVMDAYLDRIEHLNPTYNAIVAMRDRKDLLDEAALADKDLDEGRDRGWMHGMPHAIKDLDDARGLQSSYGSRIFAGQVATSDSLFVERIRNAGAIFIGKTNAPEFGYGSHTYNDVFGTTFNAYDTNVTAGGSSGGAAVGLATHMLPVADGSDMMGSLRNPAGYNNVIGFRPSRGRVAEYPRTDLFYQQLAVSGPMGRNVEDTIRLLGTMAGYDARDALSLRDSIPNFEAFSPVKIENTRIGWLGDYDGYLPVEDDVMQTCRAALDKISSLGATVSDCMPDFDMTTLWRTWLTLRHWGASGSLALYENPKFKALMKPELIWEIEGSFSITGPQLKEAGTDRTDWYRALTALFDHYDVLALPTAQLFPFDAKWHWPKSVKGREMDTYHRWMEVVIGGTLAGLPVVALPAGFNADGVPIGMQFMGRAGEDQRVLEFALAWESATDYLKVRPDTPAPKG